jgi:fermentation-respiration switch protein FrsA (DUF1100 family)
MLSGKNSPKHIALSQRLADRDIASLRFDFTSRYESEGPIEEMTYGQGVADLRAAVGFAREALGPLPLGLHGSSMGGAIVLLYAAGHGGVDAIATIAAVGSPGPLWKDWLGPEGMARWEREGWTAFEEQRIPWSFYRDAASRDAIAAASQIRCPLLVVHGDADQIVPVEQAVAIHAAAAGPKRIVLIPGGGHRFDQPGELERMLREVTGWFVENLI